MTRVLGIDPGSRITGYGIVEVDRSRHVYVASGCVRIAGSTLPERLKVIFDSVAELVTTYHPDEMAIERVFMHRNADSALKLGQARGAAICAGVTRELVVAEYSPREIKQAVVGRGAADKGQVQHMIRALLNLSDHPQADAADALAVALCHIHTRQGLERLPGVRGKRGGRLQ
ncbi:MAG: crossover junction endodeoxyribonuclease RuvC [Gammaproteobacteria bacterium]